MEAVRRTMDGLPEYYQAIVKPVDGLEEGNAEQLLFDATEALEHL